MPTWADAVRIATALPETIESTSYGTPALKVRGKLLARHRTEAEGKLAVMCDLAEKEALLASGDPVFSTTPHYDGYGMILVDLDLVDPVQLEELLTEAWRLKAPPKLRREHDEG
ncbi:hypothetical protein EV643_13727 [Kribbella sp. VKM Ac-2527]|uniref:YjbR protein n=1 Tax=Kribbella caucasensis TaxID=2512215 RepID=A0A4R6J5B2_9ACTN|nr:MmcQ/YjbR family DNA-binding protein [Kribbella sp. VKM Ac-2527]TDO30600.1 hypothetical protein EV643_13727 [Kribbella sp. VKM Ac-2527]